MTIKMIKTGKTEKVNDSYGLRLISQGLAVLAKEPASPKKRAKATGGEA